MKFTKNDLHFKDYSWAADGGDNPHYKGYLDRKRVDKTEGYEVVYFCNDFLVDYDRPLTVANFQWAEKILRTPALSSVQSRIVLNEEVNKRWSTFLFFTA